MRKLAGLFVVCLIGLISQSAIAQQGLSANVEAVENGVAFHLTNTGDSPISILRWETPFENELTQDIFAVVPSSNGKPDRFARRAEYSGRVLKRGNPGIDDYLVIDPGATVSAEVALAEYYELAADGLHTAQFTGSFTLESLSFGRRTVHSHSQRDPKAGGIETEAVAVHLVAPPKAAFAVAGGFNSCSAEQQAQLPLDLDASEQITLEALAAMQNLPVNERAGSPRYLHWFGAYSEQRYNRVMDTYRNAADRMADGSVEFNCNCNEQFFAFVFPIDPFKVYLCNAYWQADRFGTDSRAGTILHELSHFPEVAGTRDFAYGAVTTANLALSNPVNAVNNADTIEYFAENTPFREISAGEAEVVAPVLADYQVLQLGTPVSGSLNVNDSAFFEVSGADFVELTSLSGDADLFIYSTAARDNLLCRSESSGNTDRCDLSVASTAYIEVFGFSQSTFSIVAAPSAPVVSQQLVLGETITRSVSAGQDMYFVVNGAEIVEIESLTGDADLYVHSDEARTAETCSSLAFSEETVFDSCELSGDTAYITVHGFTDADFTVAARSITTAVVEADPVEVDVTLDADGGSEVDVPEVVTTDVPEVATTDAPEVTTTDVPEVVTTDAPEVTTTDVPEVVTTDIPEVTTTDAPGVTTTDVSEVVETNVSDAGATDVPTTVDEADTTDAVEVSANDVNEVETTDTDAGGVATADENAVGDEPDSTVVTTVTGNGGNLADDAVESGGSGGGVASIGLLAMLTTLLCYRRRTVASIKNIRAV